MNVFLSFRFLVTCLFLLVLSCITVNVNFPETAVQRAADDFVHDLYSNPPTEKSSEGTFYRFYFPKKFEIKVGISEAYAQVINTQTPKTKKIKARMAKRVKKISLLKKEGILGESVDGNLVLKNPQKAAKYEKYGLKKTQKLIEQENEDREELYEEIEEANKLSDKNHSRIRKIFGKAFQNNSPKGTWIEDADGNWDQKKASPKAKEKN